MTLFVHNDLPFLPLPYELRLQISQIIAKDKFNILREKLRKTIKFYVMKESREGGTEEWEKLWRQRGLSHVVGQGYVLMYYDWVECCNCSKYFRTSWIVNNTGEWAFTSREYTGLCVFHKK